MNNKQADRVKTKVAETQTEEEMHAIDFPFNVESALRFSYLHLYF